MTDSNARSPVKTAMTPAVPRTSLLRNRLFDSRPLVVHNHGRRTPQSNPWFQSWVHAVEALPRQGWGHPEIVVFGWSNEPHTGPLERTCRHMGIGCEIIGREHSSWSNRYKITTALEAMARCDRRWVLFADACDVAIFGDLAGLIPLPENCVLLFNAENNHYPHDAGTAAFEESISPPPFQYLNAGVCLGDRERSLQLFRTALEICGDSDDWGADQRALKQLYQRVHPAIQVDSRCRVFQSIRGINPYDILNPPPAPESALQEGAGAGGDAGPAWVAARGLGSAEEKS